MSTKHIYIRTHSNREIDEKKLWMLLRNAGYDALAVTIFDSMESLSKDLKDNINQVATPELLSDDDYAIIPRLQLSEINSLSPEARSELAAAILRNKEKDNEK